MISSQIVLGLQTIVSRQVDVTLEPAVVSIGAIKGGVRDNIIPDAVEMLGTVRTFNEEMRTDIHDRIRKTVELIAQSAGATAQVHFDNAYPVTVNDIPLTERMVPTLERVRRKGQSIRRPENHGLRGFFLLPAEDSGFLLLHRHYATRSGSQAVRAESFAAVLRRRVGVAARRTIAGEPDARLHGVARTAGLKSAHKTISSGGQKMTSIRRIIPFVLLLSAVFIPATMLRADSDEAGFIRIQPEDIQWKDAPGYNGVKMAVIAGDPSKPGCLCGAREISARSDVAAAFSSRRSLRDRHQGNLVDRDRGHFRS